MIFKIAGCFACGLLLSGAKEVVEPNFTNYKVVIPGSDRTIDMVSITGGSFEMGSPQGEYGRQDDEGPQRQVTVGDFYMSTLEVTWDLYELFLYREIDNVKGQKGSINLGVDAVSGATMPYVNFNRPGYPVICITQYAAATFCKWLTAKTGQFYRLPTEAEWEYACRAGSTTPYSFGDDEYDLDEYGWYEDNSANTFQKPGQKKPNPWGLYDMHGNAAEWVIDTYVSPYQGASTNPLYLEEESLYPHVVRGGSWNETADRLRSAARGYSTKDWKKRDPQFPKSLWWLTDAQHVGFRIVRPVEVPTNMDKYWLKPIEEY
ncbi:MAG: formylglycine-generating enzyme family protein [Cyclobacteriaceae bacterium]